MSEMKHIQSKLKLREYMGLKKVAGEHGLTIADAVKEAVRDWIREKSGVDKNDPFFKTSGMFRSKPDLAEKHDEIYGE